MHVDVNIFCHFKDCFHISVACCVADTCSTVPGLTGGVLLISLSFIAAWMYLGYIALEIQEFNLCFTNKQPPSANTTMPHLFT